MIRRFVPYILLFTMALYACGQADVYTEIVEGISVSEPQWDGNLMVLRIRNQSDFEYCIFEDGTFSGEDVIEGNARSIELGPAVDTDRIEELRFFNGRDGGEIIVISPGEQEIRIGPILDRNNRGFELAVSIFKCQPEDDGRHKSLVYTSSRSR